MGATGVITETKGRSAFQLWLECAHSDEYRDQVRRAVVAHATAGDRTGRELWLAVRLADGPAWWQDFDAPADVSAWCVIYSRYRDEFVYKNVPETMGPGSYNVPDKVWQALTPLVDPERDRYAADWRQGVAEFRSQLPAGPRRRPRPGETVTFDHAAWGDELGVTFTFEGRSVFACPDGFRVRLRGWSTVGMTVTGKAA